MGGVGAHPGVCSWGREILWETGLGSSKHLPAPHGCMRAPWRGDFPPGNEFLHRGSFPLFRHPSPGFKQSHQARTLIKDFRKPFGKPFAIPFREPFNPGTAPAARLFLFCRGGLKRGAVEVGVVLPDNSRRTPGVLPNYSLSTQ